jgi:hypothetical protein
MLFLYVSGPLRAPTEEQMVENINRARDIAIELWERGHAVCCPHTNTLWPPSACNVPPHRYIEGDLLIVSRCDGVVMMPGWGRSEGAIKEHFHAKNLGIPIWYYPDMPEVE